MIPVTRRGFFGAIAGAVAAAALPWTPPATPPVLMFKGARLVFDEGARDGAVMGINRATYKFWRNQQTYAPFTESDFDAFRHAYDQCARGPMQ